MFNQNTQKWGWSGGLWLGGIIVSLLLYAGCSACGQWRSASGKCNPKVRTIITEPETVTQGQENIEVITTVLNAGGATCRIAGITPKLYYFDADSQTYKDGSVFFTAREINVSNEKPSTEIESEDEETLEVTDLRELDLTTNPVTIKKGKLAYFRHY